MMRDIFASRRGHKFRVAEDDKLPKIRGDST